MQGKKTRPTNQTIEELYDDYCMQLSDYLAQYQMVYGFPLMPLYPDSRVTQLETLIDLYENLLGYYQ